MPIDDTPIIRMEDVCTTNLDSIPEIPIYRPTEEEFKDFAKFIELIEARGGHHLGICKIIPPSGWVARKNGYYDEKLDEMIIPNPILQTTVGNDGIYVQDIKSEKSMTWKEYREYAYTKNMTPSHMDWADLERKYWSNITYSRPQYGANISGTLTDKSQKIWNVAYLPTLLDEVLREQNLFLDGVNTPYLYFGSWQTTFGWHIEDVDLYSINYLHYGMPKHWYVIPPAFARKFEMIARDLYKADFLKCNAFLRHKTVVLSPHFLKRQGIPTRKIIQEENEFMYTFPYGYHAGFNMGLNIAESTNFAGPRWIEFGKQARLCHCWPDTVKINMDPFVKKYHPSQYENWKNGKDNVIHPLKEYENKINEMKKMFKSSSYKRKCIEIISVTESKIPKIEEEVKIENCLVKKLPVFFDLFATASADTKGKSRIQRAHPSKSSLIFNVSKEEKLIKQEYLINNNNNGKDTKEKDNLMKSKDSTLGKVLPRLLDGNFRALWSGVPFDFQVEKDFNLLIGSFYPHCAICSIIWPVSKVNEILSNGKPSATKVPRSTEPHIPQLAFLKSNDNKLVVSSQLKSPILKCANCNLTVHARCYGKLDLDRILSKDNDNNDNWICDRCLKFNQITHCCLCPIRGGALKKISNGQNQWAHVVCALGSQDIVFDDVLRRRPRLPDFQEGFISQKCIICRTRQINLPMGNCAFTNCKSSLHITCAFFHNVLIDSDTYPNLFYVICDKHPSYYTKPPPNNVLRTIFPGDLVYAQSPSTGYYYLGTVKELVSKAFCKLIFPSGEYSDDTEFEFIKSHNIRKDGAPSLGTVVTVLWTNGELYDVTFQGIIPEKWKIFLNKLNTTIDVNRDEFYNVDEVLPPHVERFLIEDDKSLVPKRRESARIAATQVTKLENISDVESDDDSNGG